MNLATHTAKVSYLAEMGRVVKMVPFFLLDKINYMKSDANYAQCFKVDMSCI